MLGKHKKKRVQDGFLPARDFFHDEGQMSLPAPPPFGHLPYAGRNWKRDDYSAFGASSAASAFEASSAGAAASAVAAAFFAPEERRRRVAVFFTSCFTSV